ncbi:hypothetical protein [Paenibacillus sp. NAIST15-1]|uniref:hypothetical protein n=1 Tax=Paenibacillus sp. NAIST15-1 TaxID=1605994 RepID=UPI00086A0E4E|nr:hypothetical protein [Paenibacillus sp. NAIST15-1]GAV11395.1 hypothetical protein PBN151_1324 [Paenibacillus sp. NAIST15-1]
MNKRDLDIDLVICNAATPLPWFVHNTQLGRCHTYTSIDGVLTMVAEDAHTADAIFIAAAREGWPEAISRAISAEREVDRLQKALHEINDHIRGTSNPISYIVETLHQTLPEYIEKAPEF